MQNSFDIAIIGAGPAGMTAAITASEAGANVIILDDKSKAGGQIYRNANSSPLRNPSVFGPDYQKGQQLIKSFEACKARVIYEANVWHVSPSGEILFSQNKATKSLTANEILISSGAMERPFPISGWHLPGVMSAGSAQVMLKSDGLVKDNAVFIGTGPLLYLIVAQYLRFGVKVKALVDTTPKDAYLRSFAYFSGILYQLPTLKKGIGLLREIHKSRIPIYKHVKNLKITGEIRVEVVEFLSNGQRHKINTEHAFLHQGIIPNLNLTQSINLEHSWNTQQLSWQVTLNEWGQSSIKNISVAGDAGSIIGADGAELTGKISILNQLYRLGYLSENARNIRSSPLLKKIDKLNKFRRFLDEHYRPIIENRQPDDLQTIVCRCEEVTVAELKEGFNKGAHDPNELKSLTRCGMGPCQGRQCGHTVSELLSKWQNEPIEGIGYYRIRSPLRLLTLSEFADFNKITPSHSPLKIIEEKQ